MTAQELTQVLVQHGGCEKEGDQVRVPAGTDLSIWVGLGGEPLVIDRIALLTFEPAGLIAATARHERYLVAYTDVRALRLTAKSGGAGY